MNRDRENRKKVHLPDRVESTYPADAGKTERLSCSGKGFQFLENLACAYWHSEVLFTSIELSLFDRLGQGKLTLPALAVATSCKPEPLLRLLKVLETLELVVDKNGIWHNSPVTRRYLVSTSPEYIGNFLLYRKYIRPTWQELIQAVSDADSNMGTIPSMADDYATRNFFYVRAMDEIAQRKAAETAVLLDGFSLPSPFLDIGGGAGAFSRGLLQINDKGTAFVFDLPEVIRAARQLHPDPEYWSGIQTMEGNFVTHEFTADQTFGTIVISNFLHVYDPETARHLLGKAIRLLRQDGFLLIHDYFPDRNLRSSLKGRLYDLNMMLNTYNGTCHSARRITSWLRQERMDPGRVYDLPSDTSIIVSSFKKP